MVTTKVNIYVPNEIGGEKNSWSSSSQKAHRMPFSPPMYYVELIPLGTRHLLRLIITEPF